jgi:hypothetical protein
LEWWEAPPPTQLQPPPPTPCPAPPAPPTSEGKKAKKTQQEIKDHKLLKLQQQLQLPAGWHFDQAELPAGWSEGEAKAIVFRSPQGGSRHWDCRVLRATPCGIRVWWSDDTESTLEKRDWPFYWQIDTDSDSCRKRIKNCHDYQ